MKVTLLSHTPEALALLLYTKQTRLGLTTGLMDEIRAWPDEKKMEELKYMKGTILSSFEFIDYVFLIEGVTRAFTHQLVRHRVGTSFAQQSQRAVDLSEQLQHGGDGTGVAMPDSVMDNPRAAAVFDGCVTRIGKAYAHLIALGIPVQEARGLAPTNILTNIVFKANLRTLHDMALKRLCVKVQGEFQGVFRAIRSCVASEHPWALDFLQVQCGWNGTCAFHSYHMDNCPVKPHVFNGETGGAYDQVNNERPWTAAQVRAFWDGRDVVEGPVRRVGE